MAFVKELENTGVPPGQAEAQARALSAVLQKVDEVRFQDVATQRDIRELETSLRRDMRERELRMTIKLGSMLLVGVGVILVAMRFWMHTS